MEAARALIGEAWDQVPSGAVERAVIGENRVVRVSRAGRGEEGERAGEQA